MANSPGIGWLQRTDPRLFQIATLGSLLTLGIILFGVDASLPQAATIVGAAMATQSVACRIGGIRFDWRSPAITALSLTLLLRTHDPMLWAAAGICAIGSKFCLRVRGKHLFNPACLAIVTLLVTHSVWVAPGQWGTLGWSVAALVSAAGMVLSRAGRTDIAVTFLAAWAALLAARCVSLGDPWAIPLHQIQSGALLIFAFFMVTDPRSTPDSRAGRVLFAVAVAALGHWLQFRWQVREGLFYALMVVSLTTPLLDVALPHRRFRWTPAIPEARCAP